MADGTLDLEQLAAGIYARRDEAAILPVAEVAMGDWKPQPNQCHQNVTDWCENNPDYKPVRGWLYFSFFGLLGRVLFEAHSAVRAPDGKIYDITPSFAMSQYPFIVAKETEEEFAELVSEKGVTQLWHSL